MPARICTHTELQQFPQLEWAEVSPRVQPGVRTTIERVLETQDGAGIPREKWSALANSEGDDLLGLLVAADMLRCELAGNIVTYVVNRNINFTNICFVGCKFCAFSRGPREHDTYFLNPGQVAQKAVEAWHLGATEVCIQGGLPHGLPPFYYRDILRAVKAAVPGNAYPCVLAHGNRLWRGTHRYVAFRLFADVAGQWTRYPAWDRRRNSRRSKFGTFSRATSSQPRNGKKSIRTAHACGIRTTSTLMYGHVETPEHWVNQLLLFRDIQSQTGGFTEFVPLGFVHQNTLLFQQGLARPGRRWPSTSKFMPWRA